MCDKVRNFSGILTGAQVVPAVTPLLPAAIGVITVVLKGHRLHLKGKFNNLATAYTGADIRAGLPGQNSPTVLFTLVPWLRANLLSGKFKDCDNIFYLTDAQRELLLADGLYVSIYTTGNPAGAIRAQLLRVREEHEAHYVAALSGANEVPPVTSTGTGTVIATFDGCRLYLEGSFATLTGVVPATAYATLNAGAAGVVGTVLFQLTAEVVVGGQSGVFRRHANSFKLNSAQRSLLKAGSLYVNIATNLNPTGEIRGQLVKISHHLF